MIGVVSERDDRPSKPVSDANPEETRLDALQLKVRVVACLRTSHSVQPLVTVAHHVRLWVEPERLYKISSDYLDKHCVNIY